ncbi:DUF222 domain-containing protein [Nocardioides taihuensis]|uniref:DUF222 domain-containing protein n=1 Tax=Nocardioides taihuensis TaxID=1835606 RepID=A0ABW0BN94_9ACTN
MAVRRDRRTPAPRWRTGLAGPAGSAYDRTHVRLGSTTPPLDATGVRAFADALRSAGAGLDDAGRIDLIRALEELTRTAAAVQAGVTADVAESQRAEQAARGVPPARQGRGIAAQVALARRESPHRGQQHLGLATVLRDELPHTMAAFLAGRIAEWRATLVARETACLSRADRRAVDARVAGSGERIAAMDDRELQAELTRLTCELDPASLVARRRRAESERRVTLRPAPDVMSQLSALLPVKDGLSVMAALGREADRLRASGDPRSRGQIMADTLVRQVLSDPGNDGSAPPRIVINVVVPDDVLLGRRPGAGEVDGYGPVPVDLVLELADTDGAWLRRLYASPRDRRAHRRRLPGAALPPCPRPAPASARPSLPHPLVRDPDPPLRPRRHGGRRRGHLARQRTGPLRGVQPREAGPRLARTSGPGDPAHDRDGDPQRSPLPEHGPTGASACLRPGRGGPVGPRRVIHA